MGAMFGVIAIQGAVRERERTGRGQEVQAALYENNVFLMAQAMLAEAVSGKPSEPCSQGQGLRDVCREATVPVWR